MFYGIYLLLTNNKQKKMKICSKIWNILFNALISVTLILCIFMMLKYFYFKDSKAVELGSLSDWFSTLANITMAGAAILAANKAYKWFDETKHINASNAVVKVIQDCMTINSLLNAIRSNILNNNPNRFENNSHKLRVACSEFKKSKFALKAWGSHRFDKEFMENLEKIKVEAYSVSKQINSIHKRKNIITQQSLIKNIQKTARVIRGLEKKEIDDILLKKNSNSTNAL